MLKEIDYSGLRGSKFICDFCKKEINMNKDTRYKITIDSYKKPHNTKRDHIISYDLCDKCIEKYYLKKKG